MVIVIVDDLHARPLSHQFGNFCHRNLGRTKRREFELSLAGRAHGRFHCEIKLLAVFAQRGNISDDQEMRLDVIQIQTVEHPDIGRHRAKL